MKTKILVLLGLLSVCYGCYYNNEEELYNCAVDPAAIRYSTTITNMLAAYGCTGCHGGPSPSGGYNLTTYAGVRARVNDGKLWGAINHLPGYSPMPQGGSKMSACDINKVKAWIDAGAPNN